MNITSPTKWTHHSPIPNEHTCQQLSWSQTYTHVHTSFLGHTHTCTCIHTHTNTYLCMLLWVPHTHTYYIPVHTALRAIHTHVPVHAALSAPTCTSRSLHQSPPPALKPSRPRQARCLSPLQGACLHPPLLRCWSHPHSYARNKVKVRVAMQCMFLSTTMMKCAHGSAHATTLQYGCTQMRVLICECFKLTTTISSSCCCCTQANHTLCMRMCVRACF